MDWLKARISEAKKRLEFNSKYERGEITAKKTTVKLKNGDTKVVYEDADKASQFGFLISRMTARDTVGEIFRDFNRALDQMEGKQARRMDYTRHCKNKIKREQLMLLYKVLNTSVKLRSLQGICLLKA